MAYDFTNISDYVKRESDILTATLFNSNDTAGFAKFLTGVKTSVEIPKITGEAILQPEGAKAPSGSTKGELVTLATKGIVYYDSFDQDELQSKLPNEMLAPGSNNAETPKPWEEKLIDTKISSIAEQLEMTYWQGDTAGTGYNRFDGFLKAIDANTEVISANAATIVEGGVNAITIDNVRGLVESMRDAAPAKVKRNKDFSVFVGDDIFDLYIKSEKSANMYHYKPEHDNGVYRIGGSGMNLVRVAGLEGTNRMVATTGANLIVGCDVENEHNFLDIWYDKTKDLTYMRVKFRAGVTLQNPQEIVEFTLAS